MQNGDEVYTDVHICRSGYADMLFRAIDKWHVKMRHDI